jgi:hypothetical protein
VIYCELHNRFIEARSASEGKWVLRTGLPRLRFGLAWKLG